jgi:DNA-binding XRE family transcriptional regulator
MKQAELAAAVGATRAFIHNIEHGRTRVSAEIMPRIAEALHCSVEALYAPPRSGHGRS